MYADEDLPAGWLTQFRRGVFSGAGLLLLAVAGCTVPGVPGLAGARAPTPRRPRRRSRPGRCWRWPPPTAASGSTATAVTLVPLLVTALLGWLVAGQARRSESWSGGGRACPSATASASGLLARWAELGSTRAPSCAAWWPASSSSLLVGGVARAVESCWPRLSRPLPAGAAGRAGVVAVYAGGRCAAGGRLAELALRRRGRDPASASRPGVAGLPIALLGLAADPERGAGRDRLPDRTRLPARQPHLGVGAGRSSTARLPDFPLTAAAPSHADAGRRSWSSSCWPPCWPAGWACGWSPTGRRLSRLIDALAAAVLAGGVLAAGDRAGRRRHRPRCAGVGRLGLVGGRCCSADRAGRGLSVAGWTVVARFCAADVERPIARARAGRPAALRLRAGTDRTWTPDRHSRDRATRRRPAEPAKPVQARELSRSGFSRVGGVTARLVVLASGSGSTLQAVLDAAAEPDFPAAVVAAGTDRPGCGAMQRAAAAGIADFAVACADFADRAGWDAALAEPIAGWQPDLVVLAGFMRVHRRRAPSQRFAMVNTHPSLLPSFPGAHAIPDALAHGVKLSGVTVHRVDAGLDSGPILAQAAVEVRAERHRRQPAASASRRSRNPCSSSNSPIVQYDPKEHAAMTQIPVRRALISVYDKTGLVELARGLHEAGVEIVSTGSTGGTIAEAGIPVTQVVRRDRLPRDPRRPGQDAAPARARRPAGRPGQSGTPFHRRGIGHRHLPAGGVQPVPVPGDGGLRGDPGRDRRADRHRRPGDGAGLGQEPRFGRHRGRSEQLRRGADRGGQRRLRPGRPGRGWPAGPTPTPPPTTPRWPTGSASSRCWPRRFPPKKPTTSAFTPYVGLALERAAVLRYGENPHQRAALYIAAGRRSPASPRPISCTARR